MSFRAYQMDPALQKTSPVQGLERSLNIEYYRSKSFDQTKMNCRNNQRSSNPTPSTAQFDNVIGALGEVYNVDECRQACQDNSTSCLLFSYFGPQSFPFVNTCFLYSYCTVLGKLELLTGLQTSNLASLHRSM